MVVVWHLFLAIAVAVVPVWRVLADFPKRWWWRTWSGNVHVSRILVMTIVTRADVAIRPLPAFTLYGRVDEARARGVAAASVRAVHEAYEAPVHTRIDVDSAVSAVAVFAGVFGIASWWSVMHATHAAILLWVIHGLARPTMPLHIAVLTIALFEVAVTSPTFLGTLVLVVWDLLLAPAVIIMPTLRIQASRRRRGHVGPKPFTANVTIGDVAMRTFPALALGGRVHEASAHGVIATRIRAI
jgi:hypothetical protein